MAGSIHAHESSEAICQELVRTLLERQAFERTTVDEHRAGTRAGLSSEGAPVARSEV